MIDLYCLFICKSYFYDNELQNKLVFKPVFPIFVGDKTLSWKYKGFSNKTLNLLPHQIICSFLQN